jgi:hypothetical protein
MPIARTRAPAPIPKGMARFKHTSCQYRLKSAKRYTKKTKQTVVSSSLDPLGLPGAVAHAFVCKKLVWSPSPS